MLALILASTDKWILLLTVDKKKNELLRTDVVARDEDAEAEY